MVEIKKGLEDAVVLETEICYIDGQKGILKYRDYEINELINLPYEAVSYLLIFGKLPNENNLNEFSNKLRELREIKEDIKNVLTVCNLNIEAMEALRTAVSHSSHCDVDIKDNSFESNIRKATRLIAKFPTIVASFQRMRSGFEIVLPDTSLTHGANFLYMLKGTKPSELEAEIMEKDFILSAEHELNPSTYSTRITASTQSDFHSAVISGLNTLNGPLHGG